MKEDKDHNEWEPPTSHYGLTYQHHFARPHFDYSSATHPGPPMALDINGGGSLFAYPAYEICIADWNARQHLSTVTYHPSGSESGMQSYQNYLLDFCGYDYNPLNNSEPDKRAVQLIPSLVGALVLTYNIPFLRALGPRNLLNLTASTTSGIFRGQIRYWNDPKLLDLNPLLTQYAVPINVMVAKGATAATTTFSLYLNSSDEEWHKRIGPIQSFPEEYIKRFGFTLSSAHSGLQDILSMNNSIYYQSFGNVQAIGSGWVAAMMNSNNELVFPSNVTISAADTGATFNSDFTSTIVNSPNPMAWPMATYSYLGIDTSNCNSSENLLRFLNWYYTSEMTSTYLLLTGFSRIHQPVAQRVLGIIRNITCDGEVVLRLDLFDGRESGYAEVVFFSIYIIFFGISIYGIYSQSRQSNEPRYTRMAYYACSILLNAGVVPFFFSPTDTVCRSRVMLCLAYTCLLAFFAHRAHTLKSLVDQGSEPALVAFERTIKDSIHCFDVRSKWACVFVGLNSMILLLWVFVFNVHEGFTVFDKVAYSAYKYCTSDQFFFFLVFEALVFAVVTLAVIRWLLQVTNAAALSLKDSRILLFSSLNVINSFVLTGLYLLGNYTSTEDYIMIISDVNVLGLAVIITSFGFGPFLLAVLRFKPSQFEFSSSYAPPNVPGPPSSKSSSAQKSKSYKSGSQKSTIASPEKN